MNTIKSIKFTTTKGKVFNFTISKEEYRDYLKSGTVEFEVGNRFISYNGYNKNLQIFNYVNDIVVNHKIKKFK